MFPLLLSYQIYSWKMNEDSSVTRKDSESHIRVSRRQWRQNTQGHKGINPWIQRSRVERETCAWHHLSSRCPLAQS
jgi:hypothetical protein